VSGKDVADGQLLIEPGRGLSDVVVTLTDRTAELAGTLVDATDRPASGYYIVVFPTDRTYWAGASRRVPPAVRSATDGTFRFAGLRAGDYHVVALTDVDPQDLDAALLAQLVPAAISVSLQDGDRKVQNLKMGAK
jgi:hypothetical protein